MKFYNLTIKQKLLSIVFVFSLCLGGFSAMYCSSCYITIQNMSFAKVTTQTSVNIANLVHELQKERGISGTFLGSKGQEKRDELAKQRINVDKLFDTLLQQKKDQNTITFPPSLMGDLTKILESKKELDAFRTKVNAMGVEGMQNRAFYANLIKNALAFSDHAEHFITSAEVLPLFKSLTMLSQIKEKFGQVRGAVSFQLSKGSFDLPTYQSVTHLNSSVNEGLQSIQSYLPEDLKKNVSTYLLSPEFKKSQDLFETIKSNGLSGEFKNLSSATWFTEVTKAIDSLKTIEDQIITTVLTKVDQVYSKAWRDFSLSALFALFVAAVATLAYFLVTHMVCNPLKQIASVITNLARGDVKITIPGAARHDEIGDMARSLELIRTSGVESVQLRNGLNNVSSGIIIANATGNIIYHNDAIANLFRSYASDLQLYIKGLDISQLMSRPIHMFNGVDVSQKLNDIKKTVSYQLKAGECVMAITANPIANEFGEYLGTVVEFQDLTGEIKIQEEVSQLMTSAVNGDLTKRINAGNKKGFMKDLSEKMNTLMTLIEHTIVDLGVMLSAMSRGDLTVRIKKEYKGTFETLKKDANSTAENLSSITLQILQTTREVSLAVDDITSGSQNLSARTEKQAANLEETAASMEQLTSTVRTNSDNSQQANQFSQVSYETAQVGGDIVLKAVTAMKGIEQSAAKISEIITTIDEITFKTNLLALNASVEAARAGDVGKGFAVVAQEVRNLATLSGEASKEIKEIITASNAQVKEGVSLVNQTGDSLAKILDSIKHVASLVRDIAGSSSEQATGLDQINIAVTELDTMTQQNASLVQESTATANSLKMQSDELVNLANYFTIDASQASSNIMDKNGSHTTLLNNEKELNHQSQIH